MQFKKAVRTKKIEFSFTFLKMFARNKIHVALYLIPSNWLVTLGSTLAIVFLMGNFAY